MKDLGLVVQERAVEILTMEKAQSIYVTEFNSESLKQFVEDINKAHCDPSIAVITVFVDSYGGNTPDVLAMADIIKSLNKPVATIGLRKAMSCGAILLCSGTKGYRYASPNCEIMLHEVSTSTKGKAEDIKSDAHQTAKVNDKLFTVLQEQSNQKNPKFFKEQYKRRGNADWYLSSKEFKRLGLIDHIGIPKLLRY